MEPITEIEGKKFLIDKRTNILYDRETQDPIGVLQDGKIIYYPIKPTFEKSIANYTFEKSIAKDALLSNALAQPLLKVEKYMIFLNGKWVHFGAIGYKDGTLDDDDKNNRRERFLKRNARWSKAKIYTPAYLSYYLLWD